MRSFLAGLFTGSLIGVVVTLLILLIVTGFKGSEPGPKNKLLNPRVYLVAIVLLAICAVCYTFDLVKDAMLAFMVFVLLIAKLGGSKQGIVAAALTAVILAWFLPPSGSLSVTGLDNRLALAIFVLGTFVGSIIVEGDLWLKRWIASSDSDR
jgi:K+-sensing histidine kinase KdpD